MKTELLLLLSDVTSIACVIAAANLASKGAEGWGWFLLIALPSLVVLILIVLEIEND